MQGLGASKGVDRGEWNTDHATEKDLHTSELGAKMRSFAGSRSATNAGPQTTRSMDNQGTRQWSGQDTGMPEGATTTHSMTDVLQRNHKKKKKSQSGVSAKEQRERNLQSKADRNVVRAAQYGDSGRRQDVQENVRQRGLQGQTIAHGRGKKGSNTSGKYQGIIKEVIKETGGKKRRGGK